jgi:hypothetical protein
MAQPWFELLTQPLLGRRPRHPPDLDPRDGDAARDVARGHCDVDAIKYCQQSEHGSRDDYGAT